MASKKKKKKSAKRRPNKCRAALKSLLGFATSNRRYETKNPHTIPEVRKAQKALGMK